MNFDTVTVHLRSRTPWEAIDIGFALARQWYFKLWRLWLLTALPALVLLCGCSYLLPGSTAKWTLFLFWFFKPFYEPALLSWTGQALFGTQKSLTGTIREERSALTLKSIRSLLLSRFSLYRSFSLPVLQLEGLEGSEKNQRLALLRDDSTTAILLTIGGFCIEMVLTISLLSTIFWMVPDTLRWVDFDDFVFTPDNWLLFFSYVVCCSVLAPLYICSGFMMYISRRVELEAWDIEIGFKRLRQQLEQKKTGLIRKATMIILLCTLSMTVPAGSGNAAPDPTTAMSTVTSVLRQNEFGEKETRFQWVPKKQEVSHSKTPWSEIWQQLYNSLKAILDEVVPNLARYAEFLMWCVAGGLVAFLLLKSVRLRDWLTGSFSLSATGPQSPQVMFGMDLRPESLPDDIGRTCFQLLEDGKKREAIALLYRVTLSGMIHRGSLEIYPSSTEKECCSEVRKNRPGPEASFFDTLTRLWIFIAYGHRSPEVETCREIIRQWQTLYGEQS